MMRRKRRAYLEHFHKNAAGEYIYSGVHYRFLDTGKSRKRALGELWAAEGIAVAAIVAGGCIPAPGVGRCAYVLVPYVAAVIAVFSVLWALGQLAAGGEVLRDYTYDDSVKKLPRRSVVTAVCSALACLGEGVFLVFGRGAENPGFGVLFMVLEAAAAAAMVFARSAVLRLKWEKEDRESCDV